MKTMVRKLTPVLLGVLLFLSLTACTAEQVPEPHKPQYTGEFSVEDYAEYIAIDAYHTDRTYNAIDDWETAAEVGKQVMLDKYGESLFDNDKVPRGWDVQYDEAADVWYIRTYPDNSQSAIKVLGGGFDVLIRSDGTVMAVWPED